METLVVQYLPSVITVFIGIFLGRLDKKRTARIEEAQKHQAVFSLRILQCIKANNNGTLAIATAIKNGDTNGGLTAAMSILTKTEHDLTDFIDQVATGQIGRL